MPLIVILVVLTLAIMMTMHFSTNAHSLEALRLKKESRGDTTAIAAAPLQAAW